MSTYLQWCHSIDARILRFLRWHLRSLLRWRSVVTYLSAECVEWRLENFDFPPKGLDRLPLPKRTHYICYAWDFMVGSKSLGRTPWEAARRAVRLMHRRRDRFYEENGATLEDLKGI